MNKVTLVGRLVRNPELKFTPGNGTAVVTFTLAVNRKFKREGQPDADFLPVVVWGKMAEVTAQYTAKGRQVGICGRIEVRSYEINDGTRRYVTEIIAEEVEFLTSRPPASENSNMPEYGNDVTPVEDEEIPF